MNFRANISSMAGFEEMSIYLIVIFCGTQITHKILILLS